MAGLVGSDWDVDVDDDDNAVGVYSGEARGVREEAEPELRAENSSGVG